MIESIKNNRIFIHYGFKIIMALYVTLFVIMGLFSQSMNIALYYFGLIFFFGGFYCGMCGPKIFGLIFVLSHGGVGLSLMLGSLCAGIIDSPRFTDVPNLAIYEGIVVFIILFATVFVFLFNLCNPFLVDAKKVMENNKWYSLIPLSLYLVSIILTVVFLRIM